MVWVGQKRTQNSNNRFCFPGEVTGRGCVSPSSEKRGEFCGPRLRDSESRPDGGTHRSQGQRAILVHSGETLQKPVTGRGIYNIISLY